MSSVTIHSGTRVSRLLTSGTGVFSLFLISGFAIVLWVVWAAPDLAPFLPIVMVGAIGLVIVFQYPLVNLCLVLSSFVLIAGFEEGFQITEVLYGLYYVSFLSHWYFTRLFLYRESVFRRPEERILAIFFVLVSLSFPLTILFNGSLVGFVSEWLSLSFLGLYFPIREALERNRRGLVAVFGAMLFVGLFVLIRNVLNFQDVLSSAEYAYEVASGRAVTNESLLIVPAIMCLVFMIFQTRWIPRLSFAAFFLAFFAGVLLTQSRGYWLAFLIAALVIILIVPFRQKLILTISAVITLVAVIGIGLAVFGDIILLFLYGVAERFLSIMTATSDDISLVNRFKEAIGVWEHVKLNPILGYGMGVEYRVHDIIYDVTVVKTFIHNGYVALWYKFGIWGVGMFFYFFGSVIRRAYLVFRSNNLDSTVRLGGLVVVASFTGFLVSALTSNPVYINDAMFIISILAGIGGGCWSLKLTSDSNHSRVGQHAE